MCAHVGSRVLGNAVSKKMPGQKKNIINIVQTTELYLVFSLLCMSNIGS